jgi:hypothetical protein
MEEEEGRRKTEEGRKGGRKKELLELLPKEAKKNLTDRHCGVLLLQSVIFRS